MKCPVCAVVDLKNAVTANGVIIDRCPQCGGIWLDKGEIFHFTSTPTYLNYQIREALTSGKASTRVCPKNGRPMTSIRLFDEITVEHCPVSGGFWLDKEELEKLPGIDPRKLALRLDGRLDPEIEPEIEPPEERNLRNRVLREGTRNPANLLVSSAMTITGLYALLTLVLISVSVIFGLNPTSVLVTGVVIAAAQFVFGPSIMDLTLRWLYRLSWVSREELPKHLDAFIAGVCAKQGITFPRIGIINDGSPQAFTYGHTPGDSRIVLSRGLIQLLTPEELEAVAGHELGHIKHWDILVMTVAGLVPLILYYIYRSFIRSKGNSKGKGAALIIAVVSYLLYVISEYVVLWFSRIREYFADRFSGETTGRPAALASALVKIGYGLAGKDPTPANKEGQAERSARMEAIRPMGIFDYRSARSLAIAGYTPTLGGEVDKERLKGAMFWDLWNPWARFFELNSTHPLIARRIEALSEQAAAMNQEPYITFDRRRPESYWDEFFADLAVKFLPWVTITVPFLFWRQLSHAPLKLISAMFVVAGVSYLLHVLFTYTEGLDRDITIAGLLRRVKVSGVRPVACRVQGTLIGRGIPGLIYSEDFVLKDESGIIFLDYSQPIPFWNFFFGLLKAGDLVGQAVTVTGWYRRSPVPYIELRTITDAAGRTRKCYTYPMKLFAAALLMGVGAALFILITRKLL